MIGVLLAFYPAQWRRRYGEEFRAVLESRPLGPFDVADVVLGAIDARFGLRFAETSSANGGHGSMLRIGGLGAAIGGAAWIVGVGAASILGDGAGEAWLPVIMFGTVGILVGLIGLSAFQAHRDPRLAWAAFGIPAAGSVAAIVGLAGMVGVVPWIDSSSAWGLWALGLLATLLGSALFALATIRADVLSRRAAVALLIASFWVMAVASGSVSGELTPVSRAATAMAVIAFGGSWIALGLAALRRGPIRAIAPS